MNITELQPIIIMLSEQEGRLAKKIDDQDNRVCEKLNELRDINCDTNSEVRKINGRLREAEKNIVGIKKDVQSGKDRCDRNSVATDFIKVLFFIAKKPKIFFVSFVLLLIAIQVVVMYIIEHNIIARIIEMLINKLLL